MFGVEIALLSTAAKEAGKWYREVLETAEWLMVKWYEDEAQLGRQRRASAVGGAQGKGGEGGQQEKRKETRPRERGQGRQREQYKGNRGGRK